MPIVKRRRKTSAQAKIHAAELALLADSMPVGPNQNKFTVHNFHYSAKDLWPQYRDKIMEKWLELNPDTRPQCWWLFDSPVKPPFIIGKPGEWARWPEKVPSVSKQRAVLKKVIGSDRLAQ